ncbi:glycoside hydrolase [Streptomyces sp. BE20]|uniref:glycoside hydrolase n=1 Tax=Streptomyces sp. BE20 TaxID=3002525 RepID=UPI002E78082C|nr:glycoside hydrolase [Streptomyces sp. BE20]MEE1826532.1 glycoside hydrolase [Streptomyces sp. BE20]
MAAPLGAMAMAAGTGRAWADFSTTVDPTVQWGTWEGWGTSLAWWANKLGPREDLADVLFTRNTVPYLGQQLPGLGMNIVRYCAGASGDYAVGGRQMQSTSGLDGLKKIEGFQRDWSSADPDSSSFDWTVDARQRAVLQQAKQRGVDTFELFANSPQWWMLKNDNPEGAADGLCNLQDGNFDRHAAYLATVARYARDHWGIDFASVQPVNEPGLNWGYKPLMDTIQEGCFYTHAQQAELIRLTRAQLDARGLTGTLVAGLDENGTALALNTWTSPSFDAATKAATGRVNVHGYDALGGDRAGLYDAVSADGKRIWLSEYGDEWGHGLALAQNLNADLRLLHPTAWVAWQILDWRGHGAINFDEGVIVEVNPKYYVLAQYMRHIRPGMRIIDAGHPDAVAAYDGVNHKLVIVAANYQNAQWLTFDLSRFGGPGVEGALVKRWVTGVGDGQRYRYYEDTLIQGGRFWSGCGALSVQTFEVSDVYL